MTNEELVGLVLVLCAALVIAAAAFFTILAALPSTTQNRVRAGVFRASEELLRVLDGTAQWISTAIVCSA